MNIKLGAKIRRLRTERGITQESLAQKIGVSFQSVSKWETDATTPDVALLPELAVFFGVTLDDLFSLGADDHIARIDAMLRDDFIITDENFVWAERYLKGVLSENARDSEARVRLIELYRHRANRATLAARHFAEAGVRADADEVRFHRMYLNVSRERRELDRFIGFYENGGAGKTPNAHAVRAVIEACLDDRQLEKAKEWLAKLEDGVDRSLYEGDISLANGEENAARDV